MSAAQIWEADFNVGRFGGTNRSPTRVLSAALGKVSEKGVEVTLIVKSVDPISAPLLGTVTFYLHPTFTVPVIKVDPLNSVAQILICTADAFTIGVECDGGGTVLELNLANEPGFPAQLGGMIPRSSGTPTGEIGFDPNKSQDPQQNDKDSPTPPKER